MKANLKSARYYLLALLFLFGTFTIPLNQLISHAEQISTFEQYQLFDGMTLNEEIATGNMSAWLLLGSSNTRSDLSIQPVQSLTVAYDYPMLRVDTVSDTIPVTGADRWSGTNRVGVEFNTAADANTNKIYQDLTGADAVMFYVKMPNTPSDNNIIFQIRTLSLNAEGGITGSNWPVIQQGRPCNTLAKGETTWASKTCNGYNDFTMTSGFEGWVRIPLNSFDRNAAFNWVNEIVIDFKDFGGTYGPAYFGAPMVATNNVMSADVAVIDNRQNAQNLFTGEEVASSTSTSSSSTSTSSTSSSSIPPSTVDISGLSTFDQYQLFEGMTINQEIALGEMKAYILMGSTIYRDSLSIKPVQSLTGAYDYPMLCVDTVSDTTPLTGLDMWSPQTKFGIEFNTKPNYQDMTGADALMFYVKMPNTPADTGFWFETRTKGPLDTQGNEVASDAPQPCSGATYFTMTKGETTWQANALAGPKYFMTPSGFEGWVRVPFSSFNHTNNNDICNFLNEAIIYFQDFGGTYGPAYFGAPMVATNSIKSGDAAVIDDRGLIQNLFTGANMTRDEAFPPLKPGDTVNELPIANTDKEVLHPDDADITGTTVKLNWEALSGAASYRVEIYQNSSNGSALSYTFLKLLETSNTTVMVDGLTPGLRYSAVVYALDANGNKIATYDSIAFFTNDGTNSIGNSSNSDSSGNEDGTDNVDTGYTGIGMFLLIILSAFAFVMVLLTVKKRRGAKL